MNNDQILDREYTKSDQPPFFRFQIVEFVLVGLFCLLLFTEYPGTNTVINNAVLIFCLVIILYSMLRIYFEYQHKLITAFGVFLKILLLANALVIFSGILFRFFGWEYLQEMTLSALLALSFPLLIYAFCLNQISIHVKGALIFNSLALSVLALGLAFSFESWTYDSLLFYGGYLLSWISVIILALLLKNKRSDKERYHTYNYLGRSIVLIVFSSFYLL